MISHEHKMRRSSVEPSAVIRVPQDATAGAEPSSPVHRRMIRKRDSDLAKSTGCLANHPGRETSRRRGHDSPDIRRASIETGRRNRATPAQTRSSVQPRSSLQPRTSPQTSLRTLAPEALPSPMGTTRRVADASRVMESSCGASESLCSSAPPASRRRLRRRSDLEDLGRSMECLHPGRETSVRPGTPTGNRRRASPESNADPSGRRNTSDQDSPAMGTGVILGGFNVSRPGGVAMRL